MEFIRFMNLKKKRFACVLSLVLSGLMGVTTITGLEYHNLEFFKPLLAAGNGVSSASNSMYCDDYSVTGWNDEDNKEVDGFVTKAFAGRFDELLGLIKKVDEPLCHRYEEVTVYDSYWNGFEEPTKETHIKYTYETFTFAKYIDIPVEIYHTVRVGAGEKESFRIQTTSTKTQSQSLTSEKGSTSYYDFSLSHGITRGLKLLLELIGASTESSSSFSINVGGSTYSSVKNTLSSSTTYTTVYEQTFTMDNSERSYASYFQFNQRQKFKAFFTCVYEMQYDMTNWGTGLFGLDQHWKYDPVRYVGLNTYFYLIPVENPYFEVSRYKDGTSGLKEYDGNTTSSIKRI